MAIKANYQKAIRAILMFKSNIDTIDPRVPRKIAGDLGEFYVLGELEKRGFKTEHKGGHAGCDIYIPEINKRVEVRTSLLKNEGIYDKSINFFGWRIQSWGQKKVNKFDILVCVALDETFVKPKFYILTCKEALDVDDVHIPRYPNIKKKICLYENLNAFNAAIKTKPTLVTRSERIFNRSAHKFLDRWDKIHKEKK